MYELLAVANTRAVDAKENRSYLPSTGLPMKILLKEFICMKKNCSKCNGFHAFNNRDNV